MKLPQFKESPPGNCRQLCIKARAHILGLWPKWASKERLKIAIPFVLSVSLSLCLFWTASYGLSWLHRMTNWATWGPWGEDKVELTDLRNEKHVPWVNESFLPPSNTGVNGTNSFKVNADVLNGLLRLDREEIKFWQERFFQISLAVNGIIFGLVAAFKEKFRLSRPACAVGSIVCFVLGLAYFVFAKDAEDAMVANDYDLRGIQIGLGLTKPGNYLPGQAIYPMSDPVNFSEGDITNLRSFVTRLYDTTNKVCVYLTNQWRNSVIPELSLYEAFPGAISNRLTSDLIISLNQILADTNFPQVFQTSGEYVNLPAETNHFLNAFLKDAPHDQDTNVRAADLRVLNRHLLEYTFTNALGSPDPGMQFGVIGHKFVKHFVWFNTILAFIEIWVFTLLPFETQTEPIPKE